MKQHRSCCLSLSLTDFAGTPVLPAGRQDDKHTHTLSLSLSLAGAVIWEQEEIATLHRWLKPHGPWASTRVDYETLAKQPAPNMKRRSDPCVSRQTSLCHRPRKLDRSGSSNWEPPKIQGVRILTSNDRAFVIWTPTKRTPQFL